MIENTQGLPNKYRPRTFSEYCGNKYALELLQRCVFAPPAGEQFRYHAMLISGMMGSGKSTLSQLVADALTRGDKAGVITYNMSSKNTVSDARELEAEINSPSILSPVRVFLLEEAHRITKDSADILLTTVENLPADVYVIFITTEPRALRATLGDRLLNLELKPLSEAEIRGIIKKVMTQEGLHLTQGCIDLLVQRYNGSNRALINNVMLVAECKHVSEAERLMTGNFSCDVDEPEVIELVKALAQASGQPATWSNFHHLLSASYEKLRANPESARLAAGSYLAKLSLSPRNNMYLPALAPILGALGDGPLTQTNAHLKLIHIFVQAYQVLAPLNDQQQRRN